MTTIFVAKLDFGVTDAELRQEFERFGTVNKVTIAKDKETDKPRGFAFVEMPSDDQADDAIDEMDGFSFNGRSCVVKKADDRSDGGNNRPSRDGNFQNRPPRSNDNRDRPGFNRDFNKGPRDGNVGRDTRDNAIRSDRPTSVAPSGETTVTTPNIPPKKKKEGPKKDIDTTQDGKNKKTKLNPYKKSGKDSLAFDDEFDDDEINLFGFDEDEDDIDDEIASQYLINSDDDDEEWDDDDEEWDEEDEDDDF